LVIPVSGSSFLYTLLMGRAKRPKEKNKASLPKGDQGLGPLLGIEGESVVDDPGLIPVSVPKMIAHGVDDVDHNMDAINVHNSLIVGSIFSSESGRYGINRHSYQVVDRRREGTYLRELESERLLLIPASENLLVSQETVSLPDLSEEDLQRWAHSRGLPGDNHAETLRAMAEEGICDEKVSSERYRIADWVVDGDKAKRQESSEEAKRIIADMKKANRLQRSLDTWEPAESDNPAEEIIGEAQMLIARDQGDPQKIAKRLRRLVQQLPEPEGNYQYRSLHQSLTDLASLLEDGSVAKIDQWAKAEEACWAAQSCQSSARAFLPPERGEYAYDGEISKSYDWSKGWNHVETRHAGEIGEGELFQGHYGIYQRRGHRAVPVFGSRASECSIATFEGQVSLIKLDPRYILHSLG